MEDNPPTGEDIGLVLVRLMQCGQQGTDARRANGEVCISEPLTCDAGHP